MEPRKYFTSRGYVDGGILTNLANEALNLQCLPPFLRTLLVTDGTVTKHIEAYYWEPVAVDVLWQDYIRIAHPLEALQVSAGKQVLKRGVQLRGERSGDIYSYATSFLKTDSLPSELTQQLLQGLIGIGEILREVGLETYREIIDLGVHHWPSVESQPPERLRNADDLSIYRTYRILSGGKPVMQITESFPCALYGVDLAALKGARG